jgi:hypothetical protein
MDPETSAAPDLDPILLSDDIGPRDAGDLQASLLRAFGSGADVVVDTTRATSVHVAILQVLVAAERQAGDLGRSFSLVAPASGACASSFSRAGLALPGQAPAA